MKHVRKRFRRPLRFPILQLLRPQLLLGESLGVRIQPQQDLLVLQRVLLLHARPLRHGLSLRRAQDRLHFGGIDQAADVGVVHHVGREEEILLERGGGGGRAVDFVQGGEGGGGPDDETAEVAAGSELQEVEGEDRRGLHAGDVAEGADQFPAVLFGVVDDQGTASLTVTTVSKFSLAGSEFAGVGDFVEVGAGADGFEELEGGGCLGDRGVVEGFGGDDEGDFWDGGDLMATGQEERWDGGGCEGRGGGETSV